VERFERAFAEFIGVPDAIAVGSGRAGLRCLLEGLDLPEGAEVICSAFGYPVVPHLVRQMGFKLRFVDCELGTLGMDPDALRAAIRPETAAVITTHLYGVPSRVRELREVCDTVGAALVEDCAHCYGASAGGQRAGSFGAGAYFSFETSKPVNTLGGGMVTVADPEVGARVRAAAHRASARDVKWLAKRLTKTTFERLVTTPGLFDLGVYPALRFAAGRGEAGQEENRFASGYHGDEVTMKGRTGRYTNYQARLGLSQMQAMGPKLQRRRANAERLIAALDGTVPLQRPSAPDVEPNYMLVAALVEDVPGVTRGLLQRGIDTKHRYMRDCSMLLEGTAPGTFPNAERCEREVLHLPAHPELSPGRVDGIAKIVREVLAEHLSITPATPPASADARETARSR
jgi:dTDP-4-amino-4,6-dideoxygalactose transaminase